MVVSISPSAYSFSRVIDMLVFAVVGGSASFIGPVVGDAFLTLLPEGLREVSRVLGLSAGALRMFVFGMVLLLVIIFLPNGIVSLAAKIRGRRKLIFLVSKMDLS